MMPFGDWHCFVNLRAAYTSFCTGRSLRPVYVPLQNREEAQRAKDDLNGIMLHDNDLRIGWGKAIPIPSAPMFVLNPPGGIAPARGAAIAPPGSIGGAWGQPGPHDAAAVSGVRYIVSCLLHFGSNPLLKQNAAHIDRDSGTAVQDWLAWYMMSDPTFYANALLICMSKHAQHFADQAHCIIMLHSVDFIMLHSINSLFTDDWTHHVLKLAYCCRFAYVKSI